MRKILFFAIMVAIPGVAIAQEVPNVFTYKAGGIEVILLSEGQRAGGAGTLIGATPEMLAEVAPDGVIPGATNAFLLKVEGKNILIDSGYGRELFKNLESAGVTPDKVDVILITHMHGDHIGGLLQDGKVAFPNAEFYLSQPEYDHFISQESAKKVIEAYRAKLHLFQPEQLGENIKPFDSSMPYIKGVATYGHTPGHTVYIVELNGKSLMVWGDLTHSMAIQMPYPQVAVTYDSNKEDAISCRMKILEYVSKGNIPIAGMHIPFPGIGMITKAGNGYKFEQVK
jgi:Zn-dependent hydrolases, including glyoxylases